MAKKLVVRVNNWLLFPDGRSRKLSVHERMQLLMGRKLEANLTTLKTQKKK